VYDTRLEINDNLNQSVDSWQCLDYADTLGVVGHFGLNASSSFWFRLRDGTGIGCGSRAGVGRGGSSMVDGAVWRVRNKWRPMSMSRRRIRVG